MPIITIGASEVAACIGLNPYKSVAEMVTTLVAKHCPEKNIVTTDQAAEALLATSASSTELIRTIKATAGRVDPSVLEKTVQQGMASLAKEFTGAEQEQVKAYLQSKANTIQGTHFEKGTARKAMELAECTHLVEDHKVYLQTILVHGPYTFQLVGKIDRLNIESDGSRTLIEIKNRVNRLFYTVKEYENIQVQCYLQLLDLEHAKLIEHYKKGNQLHTLPIKRDQTMWETVIHPRLIDFCTQLYKAFE